MCTNLTVSLNMSGAMSFFLIEIAVAAQPMHTLLVVPFFGLATETVPKTYPHGEKQNDGCYTLRDRGTLSSFLIYDSCINLFGFEGVLRDNPVGVYGGGEVVTFMQPSLSY